MHNDQVGKVTETRGRQEVEIPVDAYFTASQSTFYHRFKLIEVKSLVELKDRQVFGHNEYFRSLQLLNYTIG